MNAMKEHMHVLTMPYVPIVMDHTSVSAAMVSQEIDFHVLI